MAYVALLQIGVRDNAGDMVVRYITIPNCWPSDLWAEGGRVREDQVMEQPTKSRSGTVQRPKGMLLPPFTLAVQAQLVASVGAEKEFSPVDPTLAWEGNRFFAFSALPSS